MKSQSEAETYQWYHQSLFDLCLTHLLQKTVLNKIHAGLQGKIFFKVFWLLSFSQEGMLPLCHLHLKLIRGCSLPSNQNTG